MTYEEARVLSESLGMHYMEASAAADLNVTDLFKKLALDIHTKVTSNRLVADNQGTQGVKINNKNRIDELNKLSSNIGDGENRLSTDRNIDQKQTGEGGCCGG